MNGGIVCTAYLIARYVDPQIRYIEANAAIICARGACLRSFNEERLKAGEGENVTRANPLRRSVEGIPPALGFLLGMPFLGFESGFPGRVRRLGCATLLRNDQRAPHQVDESLLCQLTISSLTAHVAGDDADAAIGRHPR